MRSATVVVSCTRLPPAHQATTSLALLAKITDYAVPEAHQFKVLLPRYPGLVLRVDRVSAKDDGLDLHQLHAPRGRIRSIAHSGTASLAKRSGKSLATGVA